MRIGRILFVCIVTLLLAVSTTSPTLKSGTEETGKQADTTPPYVRVELNGLTHIKFYIHQFWYHDIYLWAYISDESRIAGANFTIGRGNWPSSYPIRASDGAYDEPTELAKDDVILPEKVVGIYEYCVYAWDEHGNWDQDGSCAIVEMTNDPSDEDLVHPDPVRLTSIYALPDYNVVCCANSGDADVWLYRLQYSNNYQGLFDFVEWTTDDPPMGCYHHHGAGSKNPEDFYYRLQIFDHKMNWAFSGVVAKINVRLESGFRLLSLPVLNGNPVHLDQIYASFSDIYYYDPTDANDPWKYFSKTKPYAKPWEMGDLEFRRGYWIEMTQSDTMIAMGHILSSIRYDLVEGWNLVGYCSPYSRTVSEALSGISGYMVEGYSNEGPYHLQRLTGSSFMEPFQAYWIWVPSDTTWVLVN